MEELLNFSSAYLPPLIVAVLAFIILIFGVIGFFFDARTIYEAARAWRVSKLEFNSSLQHLKSVEYFIAHVTHIGGNFSMLHSYFVYSNEDGGFYFNPPKEFVSIGFNRGGDLMIVSPSSLASKAGFKVESVTSSSGGQSHIQDDRSFCHVGLDSLKNEYQVKFVRFEGIQ